MKIIIFIIVATMSCPVFSDVLWKPKDITFQLKQAHKVLGIGLMLELNQKLDPGEEGWTQSRIDVPENWAKAKIIMKGNTIHIDVGKNKFYLNPQNWGALSFEILDGGNKSESQLLKIWLKHASRT